MRLLRKITKSILATVQRIRRIGKDENFLLAIDKVDGIVAKILSVIMVIVIMVAILDLAFFLTKTLQDTPFGELDRTAFKAFGLFLNVLIALEILENITAYLRKHVVQV